MNILGIKVWESPDKAPHWKRDHPDIRGARFKEAHIILGGMQSGKASVDLVFVDAEGGEFVAPTTGAIIKNLAAAIEGAEQR